MAEIPDELENELMLPLLDPRLARAWDFIPKIRKVIRTAYERGWEDSEEHTKLTVGDWLDRGDLAQQL